MVVGDGFIAEHIKTYDRNNVIVFAEEVLDSKATDFKDFQFEEKILRNLIKLNADKKIVYLSTYSINDSSLSDQIYVQHKTAMEKIVKNISHNYLIIRKSNLFGALAPEKSILPYLCNSIIRGDKIEVWANAFRNILDIDHFMLMYNKVLNENIINDTIFLVNPQEFSIREIIRCCEKVIGKIANVELISKGAKFYYDTKLSGDLFDDLAISKEFYLENLLRKYLKL